MKKVYIHKVRQNLSDGWGISHGISIQILGIFGSEELANISKSKRDLSLDHIYYDVGKSWIEVENVQES